LLFSVGVVLFFAGFVITFLAVILLVLTTIRGKRKFRVGGAVIIGPFPIVFGTDRESVKMLLLLSIALITLVLILMMVYHHTLK